MPHKLDQNRRRHISQARRRATNRPAYDASLRQRGSLTVWLTNEAVAAWAADPRTTYGGQPRYNRRGHGVGERIARCLIGRHGRLRLRELFA